ncbi:MAG: Ig-like domain-containing protein [Oscillospiraceae bacterium]|nr:Ig-like domain-containing protein [Oscillospiraceae bacterium]
MKLIKSVAILATAILAVHCLPEFAKNSFVDAQTTEKNSSEIVDAIITGYEESDDPGKFRVITANDTLSNASPDESSLVHNSRFADCVKLDGIDVSKFQGTIDWNAVASDGVDFAIIRAGYRGYDGGKLVTDVMYDANMKGAIAAGLDVGVYFFTQAITEQEAIEEAKLVISKLKDYKITMPVYIDIEDISSTGRLERAKLTIKQRTAIVEAFCNEIEEAGYDAGVYASKSYYLDKLDPDYLSQRYKIWLAHYTTETNYKGDYHAWQYSDKGNVKGISTPADRDVMYSQKVKFSKTELTITEPNTSVAIDLTGDGLLSFESSDTTIATVDAVGNISGISNGTATITAISSNGSRDAIHVTVNLPENSMLAYAGIVLDQIGATENISNSANIKLVSSDSNIVAVSEDGKIKAVNYGSADITATDTNGNTAVCNVIVAQPNQLVGDCDGDGAVNAVDAVYILNLAASLGVSTDIESLSDAYFAIYDFNKDGKINSFDASEVLLKSAYAGVGINN